MVAAAEQRMGRQFVLDTHPGHTLDLLLFCGVRNSRELILALQTGVLKPEVAFFNALLVPDVFPVLAAAHKTFLAQARESLVTRTVHSELVYNYSGSKHITESLRRCGISDTTDYILVARFDSSPEDVLAIRSLIEGTEIGLSELQQRADSAQIQKLYKTCSLELETSSLADAITSRIAARDAL